MRLREGARVAIIGAGPSGIMAAKHALEAGFDVTVFEAGGALGGQWRHDGAAQRRVAGDAHEHEPGDDGVLRLSRRRLSIRCIRPPSRCTRTSRTTPARSASSSHPLRHAGRGGAARAGRSTASRSTRSSSRPAASASRGSRAWSTRSAARRSTRSTIRAPNGSGIAPRSSTATGSAVWRSRRTSRRTHRSISAFRKPRYVIQKVVDGVSSDWQWYTLFGALERRMLPAGRVEPPAARAHPPRGGQPRRLRRAGAERRPARRGRVAVSGLPGAGARRQHRVPPGIASIEGRNVTFTDGSTAAVEVIICATGYDIDIPYLSRASGTCSDRISRSTSGRSTRTCPASVSSASSSRRGRTSRCSNCRRAGSRRSGAAR